MIQFFAPDIASTQMLPEEEARHAIKVLRSHPGDILTIVDGRGMRYTCRLLSDNPRHADIEIISTEHQPPVWHTDITLAVAPTKNADRMEWLIEKVVEIGVNRIVPLLCRHSERKVMKTDRLERIAVSAMKQSLKATLPVIGPLTPIGEFIAAEGADSRFICYCDDYIERVPLVRAYTPQARSATVLIGPEGDFDPVEVKSALDAGFRPVTLGDNRLRTETAALVAVDTIHILNQLSETQQKL
ncbi:16S rRNA (uracil(1498)-N(3))-methyltransferase [Muribaculum intestinale]|uniref:16S rRNA (uracil(1498)-N(3))-methyltransferase n=2 Tax=Muribaculum intestinale TaxID=1796646 RepID=UPI00243032CE|nr:16S rRNA (uracil(1498)-N(3))-methyltransferase [Muribaculum intestinale]